MATDLYIDGKLCDLEKKEVIAMSYGVNRLTDIESRQGFYSNTFKLPLTARNLDVFGIPTELNSSDTTRWERLECSIESDGIIQIGFAQLQSVQDTLSVVVKGGNSGFIEAIRDLQLVELDLSDLDHAVTLANVEANRFNDYTDGFVYPDVDYNLLSKITNPVPYWYLYHAVFFDSILRAIVSGAGYTIAGDILSDSLFKKMVLPFSREFLRVDEAFILANSFRAKGQTGDIIKSSGGQLSQFALGFDNDSTEGYFDNPNDFNLAATTTLLASSAYYNPTVAVIQAVKFKMTFEVKDWNTDCELTIRLRGTTTTGQVAQSSTIYEHHSSENPDANGFYTIDLFANISEIPTTNTSIRVEMYNPVSSYVFSIDVISAEMYNEVSSAYSNTYDLDVAANLPDMSQSNFIKYLANAFCLLITTNPYTKVVSFDFFDNVPTNTVDDWSSKIDISEKAKITPNYGNYLRNNFFKYDNNKSDEGIKTDLDFGEYNIENTNIVSGNKDVYKAPFSASKPIPFFPERFFIDLSSATEQAEHSFSSMVIASGVASITVATTSGFEENGIVVFKDLNQATTLDGDLLNGLEKVQILEVVSPTVFTIQGVAATASTSGIVIHMKNAGESKDPKPRVGVHEVVDTDGVGLIQLINGSTVFQTSRLTFTDIKFSNLIPKYGSTLTSIILKPQMVNLLMRLSAVDINQLDFTRPKWIEMYQCYFYLSFVSQYKVNQVDSTEVELIKLP